MKEKVTKRLETRVAELIMVVLFATILLSSCGNAGYCMQNEALNPLSQQYSRTCNK
tara:strand:- start:2424 stop:2591 length:168 start_codon:yes stop_codon:yes gene_type:complete